MGEPLTPEQERQIREWVAEDKRRGAINMLASHGTASGLTVDALLATLAAERARTVVLTDALRADLDETPCNVVHGGYPKGTTCLDIQVLAADPATRFGDEYRAAILAGAHLCFRCKVRATLSVLPVDRVGVEPLDAETLADILAGHRLDNGFIAPPLIPNDSGQGSRLMDPHEFACAIFEDAARLIESPTEGET